MLFVNWWIEWKITNIKWQKKLIFRDIRRRIHIKTFTTISEQVITNPIWSRLSPGIFSYNQQRAFRFPFENTCDHLYCLRYLPSVNRKIVAGSKYNLSVTYTIYSLLVSFVFSSLIVVGHIYVFPRLTLKSDKQKTLFGHFVHFLLLLYFFRSTI